MLFLTGTGIYIHFLERIKLHDLLYLYVNKPFISFIILEVVDAIRNEETKFLLFNYTFSKQLLFIVLLLLHRMKYFKNFFIYMFCCFNSPPPPLKKRFGL